MGIPPLQFQQQPGPLDNFGKALQIKQMMGAGQLQQQQLQENAITLQQKRQQMQEQELIKQTLGANNGDLEASLPQLAGKVNPKTLSDLTTWATNKKKESLEIGEKERAAKIAQGDQLLGLIAQAKALPPDQYAANWGQIASTAMKIRPDLKVNPQQPVPQEALDSLALGIVTDTQFYKKADEERKVKESAAKLPGEQADADVKVRANAASQLGAATTKEQYAQLWGELPAKVARQFPQPEQWTPESKDTILQAGMTPHEQASVPVDKIELKDFLRKYPGKTASDFAAWKASLAPAARISIENAAAKPINNADGTTDVAATAKKFGMTQASFDQQAENFYLTGKLPPLGRGISGIGLQRALMNRTAELHPNGNLAANSAEYKANQESLKKLQTNFDQVSAFEATARKNMDLLQQTAAQIPDLGLRFANVPVRAISERMIGTEKMAAFRTALNTAQTEAAKVLNSSNASGVLSDSARHELQSIVDGNLSYKAMVASLDTLRQDMKNRHDSYQEQITAIQGRFNTTSNPPQGGGQQPPPAGGFNWDAHPKVQ